MSETKAAVTYYQEALRRLGELGRTQTEVIQQAADLCADRISKGGLVFLFGNGHSRMMCEEMTPRQGCFPGFVALVELALSNHANIVGSNGLRAPLYLEGYEGYSEQILKSYKFGPHDVFIVISTSGIRPVIVEMAMGAQKRGLPVIGIVAKAHCEVAKAAHSSGKKLIDCADIIIDMVGGKIAEQSLRVLNWRGRFIVVGFAGGTIPNLPANRLLLKAASAIGVFWGETAKREPATVQAVFADLMGLLAAGKIKPVVTSTYNLSNAPQAMIDLATRKTHGKVVLVPD